MAGDHERRVDEPVPSGAVDRGPDAGTERVGDDGPEGVPGVGDDGDGEGAGGVGWQGAEPVVVRPLQENLHRGGDALAQVVGVALGRHEHEVGVLALVGIHALGVTDDPEHVALSRRPVDRHDAAQDDVHVPASARDVTGPVRGLDQGAVTQTTEGAGEGVREVPVAPGRGAADGGSRHRQREASARGGVVWLQRPNDRRTASVEELAPGRIARRHGASRIRAGVDGTVVEDDRRGDGQDSSTLAAEAEAQVDCRDVGVIRRRDTSDRGKGVPPDDEACRATGSDRRGCGLRGGSRARGVRSGGGHASVGHLDLAPELADEGVLGRGEQPGSSRVHEQRRRRDHIVADRRGEAGQPRVAEWFGVRPEQADELARGPLGAEPEGGRAASRPWAVTTTSAPRGGGVSGSVRTTTTSQRPVRFGSVRGAAHAEPPGTATTTPSGFRRELAGGR
ncbi:MAG: hypothetical protein U5R31_04050 [Acidimicrobiia bacterium]|nr:hypothetical protein [Acidimicrobiia bacterium]